MSEQEEPSAFAMFSICEVYYLLFRHKWKILLFSLGGAIAAAVVFITTPTIYRSEARLFVRFITDSTIVDPQATGGAVVSGLGNVINAEIAIIQSLDLAERVANVVGPEQVTKLGAGKVTLQSAALDFLRRLKVIPPEALAPETPSVSDAIKAAWVVNQNLGVRVSKRSNLLNLSYDAPDPQLAQIVLSRLIENYLRKHMEIHGAASAYDFLAQQTDQLRARLSQTEDEIRRVRQEAGIVDLEERKKNVGGRMEDLLVETQETEVALATARERLETIRETMPEGSDPARENLSQDLAMARAYTNAEEYLGQLRRREMELLAVYREDSIPVQSIRDQIAKISRIMMGQGGAQIPTPSATYAEMLRSGSGVTNASPPAFVSPRVLYFHQKSQVTALEEQLKRLADQLVRVKDEARQFDKVETRILQLQREKQLQEANYRYFSQSLERARIDDTLDSAAISDISIVQPATLPMGRIRPDFERKMAIALAIGVFSGLALAVASEYFLDRSFKRPSQIASALHLPTLATIPYRPRIRRTLSKVPKRKLLKAANPDDTPEGPTWEIHEGLRDFYEALRHQVILSLDPGKRPPYLIGITGCAVGSGATTIATSLAVTLAQDADNRVLLADTDLARGSAHRVFGMSASSGLVDILADGNGNTALVQQNLYILPAGRSDRDPPAVGLPGRFEEFIRSLKNSNYKYVVLDMPPVTEISTTLRTANLLDGMILVVEAEKDRREAAQHAKELLVMGKANVIGTVLNKRRRYVPRWLAEEY